MIGLAAFFAWLAVDEDDEDEDDEEGEEVEADASGNEAEHGKPHAD